VKSVQVAGDRVEGERAERVRVDVRVGPERVVQLLVGVCCASRLEQRASERLPRVRWEQPAASVKRVEQAREDVRRVDDAPQIAVVDRVVLDRRVAERCRLVRACRLRIQKLLPV